MVIINLRDKAKEQTKERILANTEVLLIEYGIIKTTTKMIADQSSVSHGTIFLHFGTKENLFNELLMSNIVDLENMLKSKCNIAKKPSFFISKVLDVIGQHENLLSRLYKDEAYLSDDLNKCIDNYENTLKNLLLDNYRSYSKKRVSIVDAFVAIDAFLSQLRFYLIKKEFSTHQISLIKQKKGRITKLYNILFGDK